MCPAGDGNYNECAYDCGSDNGKPLVSQESKALHQPHSRRNEKESEITHQKVGYAVDPHKADYV